MIDDPCRQLRHGEIEIEFGGQSAIFQECDIDLVCEIVAGRISISLATEMVRAREAEER